MRDGGRNWPVRRVSRVAIRGRRSVVRGSVDRPFVLLGWGVRRGISASFQTRRASKDLHAFTEVRSSDCDAMRSMHWAA